MANVGRFLDCNLHILQYICTMNSEKILKIFLRLKMPVDLQSGSCESKAMH